MIDFAAAVPGCAWPVDAGRCTPKGDRGSATSPFRRVPSLRRGTRAAGRGRGIGHQLGENFRCRAVLLVPMSRLLVILTLLAAALPAAAGAQTPAEPPVAVTGAADSLTETTANLNGSVDPNGTATHPTYHFEYGTSAGYGLVTPEADAGAGTDPVAVQAPITGLTRNTTYHYRLVATQGTVPVFGADRTFRTATGPVPPRVKATGSREVQSRSALLITQVDPNAQATTVRFEYGRSTGYGSHTATIDAGKTDGYKPFSMAIDRLRPNTRYHFRAVATNAAGTTRSLDRSFVTTREPTGISVALAPSKVTWGQDLTVIGRIRGVAVGGTGVALERQSFPFQSGFSEVARKTAKSDGTFQFNVNSLFQTTHYRVVTLTKTAGRQPRLHGVERGQGPRHRQLARPPAGAHQGRDLAAGAERPRPAQEALAARALGRGQACEGEGLRRQPLALLLQGQAHPQAGPVPRHRAADRRRRARGRALEAGAREEAAQEALTPS